MKSTTEVINRPDAPITLNEDQLAAVAFLARCNGRTLETYGDDVRALFRWAAEHGLALLAATRTHLELSGAGWRNVPARRSSVVAAAGQSLGARAAYG